MKNIRGRIVTTLVSTFGVGAGCAAILALMALGPLALGFWIMLGFGVVHHEISASVSPIGYWPSVLLAMAVTAVGSVFKSVTK